MNIAVYYFGNGAERTAPIPHKREVYMLIFWLEWLAPRMPLIAGFLGFIFELLR